MALNRNFENIEPGSNTTIKFQHEIDENPHVVNTATYNSLGSTFVRLIELRELGHSNSSMQQHPSTSAVPISLPSPIHLLVILLPCSISCK